VARPLAAIPAVTGDELPLPGVGTTQVQDLSAQQLSEIRSMWRELLTALEEGNWTRYGQLLTDLDAKINSR